MSRHHLSEVCISLGRLFDRKDKLIRKNYIIIERIIILYALTNLIVVVRSSYHCDVNNIHTNACIL